MIACKLQLTCGRILAFFSLCISFAVFYGPDTTPRE